MVQINYYKLDYDRKLLYVRSVFEEAKSVHPVYDKLYVLLSGQRSIQESYLDQLYEQVQQVVESMASAGALEAMSELARKIAAIREREAADKQQELADIAQMEKDIMKIDDDRPTPFV